MTPLANPYDAEAREAREAASTAAAQARHEARRNDDCGVTDEEMLRRQLLAYEMEGLL